MTGDVTQIPILFDPGPIIALQRLFGLGWPEPWIALSLLGIDWGIILAVGIALWMWGRRVAYGLLAVVVVEGGLKMALNQLVSMPRPDAPGLVRYEHVSVSSFPSGHVSTATALWSWLAVQGRVSWAIPAAVAVLVGTSRLYLGVHYVGDVVGAVLLAAVAVVLVQWIWPPVRAWLTARPFALFAGAAMLALAFVIAGPFLFFGEDPYRWRAGGLVAGFAIALPLEYRFVRYEPGEQSPGRRVAMLLTGGVGIAALAAGDQLTDSYVLSLVLATVAGVWALLVAPATFVLLGWCRRPVPSADEAGSRRDASRVPPPEDAGSYGSGRPGGMG